ncbi:vWA domain-containing protein [Corynebacterium pacaense]|uniref:vWA domain-containing protein n=1 Tax=Corynebacterium pacaense TaxID=1816684 RepID=UPI001FE3CB0F|nr:vWA domain-containing protein [Corynebacterium pacaense]
MAKHSSGRRNFALSTPLTLALIAAVAIVAVVLWLLTRPDSPDSEAEAGSAPCIAGDLEVPVGGEDTVVAPAVAEFNAQSHVTRDFCVTATAAAAGDPAATYLFSGTKQEAAAELAKTSRVASGSQESWPQAGTEAAGVASTDGTASLDAIRFDDSSASAAVALALAGGDEQAAAEAIATGPANAQAFATRESAVIPEGYTFAPIDGAQLPVWAIATNAGGTITEDQARAGADFVSALPEATRVADLAQITSVMERVADRSTDVPAAAGPADTLILMDTSANMEEVVGGSEQSYHTVVSTITSGLAREVGARGFQVALNNYSSPLNPGVTRGWRANVSFPDDSAGENAAGAVLRFGTGGVPLTRSATVAAAQIASERAAASGQPVNLVVVSSGSVGDYADDAFLADLTAAAGDRVRVNVVHVGNGEPDAVLSDWATGHGGSVATASTEDELNTRLRAAFGV